MAHGARSLKDESGTLQFDAMAPRDDETKVMLYEVYRDDDAFDAHFNGASIAKLRKDTAGLIVKITSTRGTPAE